MRREGGEKDHVAAAVEVHDRRVAVPETRRGPQTAHLGGISVGDALGLRGHVLGVLSGLSLVWKIHVHGLRGVAEYLVELEGFGAYHPLLLLPVHASA